MIADNLDPVTFWNFKLVCKDIHMWTKSLPKLSATEWVQYHSVFETHARRRHAHLQILGCSGCKKHLSKGLFSDAEHTNYSKKTAYVSAVRSVRVPTTNAV